QRRMVPRRDFVRDFDRAAAVRGRIGVLGDREGDQGRAAAGALGLARCAPGAGGSGRARAAAGAVGAIRERGGSGARDRGVRHRGEIYFAAARVQEDGPEARWGSVIEGGSAAGVTRISGPEGWVRAAAFAPGGETIAAASSDGTARLFDLGTGRERWSFRGAYP